MASTRAGGGALRACRFFSSSSAAFARMASIRFDVPFLLRGTLALGLRDEPRDELRADGDVPLLRP